MQQQGKFCQWKWRRDWTWRNRTSFVVKTHYVVVVCGRDWFPYFPLISTAEYVKDDYGHYISANTKIIEGNYDKFFKNQRKGTCINLIHQNQPQDDVLKLLVYVQYLWRLSKWDLKRLKQCFWWHIKSLYLFWFVWHLLSVQIQRLVLWILSHLTARVSFNVLLNRELQYKFFVSYICLVTDYICTMFGSSNLCLLFLYFFTKWKPFKSQELTYELFSLFLFIGIFIEVYYY